MRTGFTDTRGREDSPARQEMGAQWEVVWEDCDQCLTFRRRGFINIKQMRSLFLGGCFGWDAWLPVLGSWSVICVLGLRYNLRAGASYWFWYVYKCFCFQYPFFSCSHVVAPLLSVLSPPTPLYGVESTLQAARQIQCLVLKCVYIYRGDQVQTRIVNLYVVIVRGLGYGRADIITSVTCKRENVRHACLRRFGSPKRLPILQGWRSSGCVVTRVSCLFLVLWRWLGFSYRISNWKSTSD